MPLTALVRNIFFGIVALQYAKIYPEVIPMKSMTEISKLIGRVLRHKPDALSLTLDEHG